LSESKQVTKSIANVPLFSIIILSIVCVFGLFIVGYDQGHIFSVVQGEQAYVDQFIHELTHDIRHAASWKKIIEQSSGYDNDIIHAAKKSISSQNLLLDSCFEEYC